MPRTPGTIYLDEQVARAAAALGAAGIWDAAPTEVVCAGALSVTYYLTYTRGGAGGAVDSQIQTSPYSADRAGVEDWFTQDIYAGAAVVPGADTTSTIQRELITYQAVAAAAEMYVLDPIDLGGTVERIRIRCRESGNVGLPGDVHIVAMFSWD